MRHTQNAGNIRRNRFQKYAISPFCCALPASRNPLIPKKPYRAGVPSVVLLSIPSEDGFDSWLAWVKITVLTSTRRRKFKLLCFKLRVSPTETCRLVGTVSGLVPTTDTPLTWLHDNERPERPHAAATSGAQARERSWAATAPFRPRIASGM